MPIKDVVMDWNIFSVALGALGLGSLLTAGLQIFYQRKKDRENRTFEEKKQAYLEYIKAVQESQTMQNSKEAAWKRTAAMARIELFGSEEVLKALEIVSQVHNADLTMPLKKLFKAMRKDLNVN